MSKFSRLNNKNNNICNKYIVLLILADRLDLILKLWDRTFGINSSESYLVLFLSVHLKTKVLLWQIKCSTFEVSMCSMSFGDPASGKAIRRRRRGICSVCILQCRFVLLVLLLTSISFLDPVLIFISNCGSSVFLSFFLYCTAFINPLVNRYPIYE